MPVEKKTKERKTWSVCWVACDRGTENVEERSICKSSVVFIITNSKQLLSPSIRKSCLSYFSRLHSCILYACLLVCQLDSNTVHIFTDGAAPVSALILPRYFSLEKKYPNKLIWNSILSALWLFSLRLLCFPRVFSPKRKPNYFLIWKIVSVHFSFIHSLYSIQCECKNIHYFKVSEGNRYETWNFYSRCWLLNIAEQLQHLTLPRSLRMISVWVGQFYN